LSGPIHFFTHIFIFFPLDRTILLPFGETTGRGVHTVYNIPDGLYGVRSTIPEDILRTESTFSHFRVYDSSSWAVYSMCTKYKPIIADQRPVVRWSQCANNAIGPVTKDSPLSPVVVPMTTPSYPSQLPSLAPSVRGTTECSTVGLI
jgi:hypothetical protein